MADKIASPVGFLESMTAAQKSKLVTVLRLLHDEAGPSHIEDNPKAAIWRSHEGKRFFANVPTYGLEEPLHPAPIRTSNLPVRHQLRPVRLTITDASRSGSSARTRTHYMKEDGIFALDSERLRVLVRTDEFTGQAHIAAAAMDPTLSLAIDIRIDKNKGTPINAPNGTTRAAADAGESAVLTDWISKMTEKHGAKDTMTFLDMLLNVINA